MKRILLYLLLCVVAVGCGKDGATPSKPTDKHLTVSKPELTLTNAQNSSEVTISAQVGWTAASNSEWLSVTPTSGSGDAIITITAQENTTDAERKGRITVSSSAGDKVIEVTNSAADEDDKYLSLSSKALTLTNAESSSEIEIYASVEWTVKSNSEWLSVTPTSGTGSAKLTITAQENNTDAERKGQIDISSSVANPTIEVTNSAPELTVEKESYKFNTPTDLKITSNTSWAIDPSEASWCSFSTLSGKGDATVVMTPSPTSNSKPAIVAINYNTKSVDISITYDRANVAPSVPVLSAPLNNAKKVALLPSFSWQASTNGNGDAIKYKLYLSRWSDAMNEHEEETTSTSVSLTDPLEPNWKYYWKVEASDADGNISESEIYSFTTDVGSRYADGEVRIYQESSSGYNPVYLVFMGDGFIAEDFDTGGYFDQIMDEAIKGFFEIEPYKTYQNYFTVYKVAAHSAQRGASVSSEGITVNTAFSSRLDGFFSGITCDEPKVFEYAKRAGIPESEYNKTAIVLAINIDRYAGMCTVYSEGRSLAMCPVSRSSSIPNGRFKNIINHEAGGHGYGRLADEYYDDYPSMTREQMEKLLTEWQGYPKNDRNVPYFPNVSLSSQPNNVGWGDFIGKQGYSAVGLHEGAFYFAKDVWRPEDNSCMNDNIGYYNVASRYSIYKRIMTSAKRPDWSVNDFIANDKVRVNPYGRASKATKNFVPLAPPRMVR